MNKRALLFLTLMGLTSGIALQAQATELKPVPDYSSFLQNCMGHALRREYPAGQWGSAVDRQFNKALCNCRYAKLSRQRFMSYEQFAGTNNACLSESQSGFLNWFQRYVTLYDAP